MLQIIYPLKDRISIIESIRSVIHLDFVSDIYVVDCGTSNPELLNYLRSKNLDKKIKIIWKYQKYFSRSNSINTGIKVCSDGYILISDSDIIWNKNSLKGMLENAKKSKFVSVENVTESETLPKSNHIPLNFQITKVNSNEFKIDIFPTKHRNSKRSGPGLIMAHSKLWIDIGGYNEKFEGWGWEDQDLIIRAKLLGYEHSFYGEVIHLSHDNSIRNSDNDFSISQSRNRNIKTSCDLINLGNLRGALNNEALNKNIIVNFNIPEYIRLNEVTNNN